MQAPKTGLIATVLLDDALSKALSYDIPNEFINDISPGTRVLVPVRNSMRQATVWEVKEKTDDTPQLKSIEKLLSEKSVATPDLLHLAQWISKYYCCPLHKVLTTVLPSSIRGEANEKLGLYIKKNTSQEKLVELCGQLRISDPKQALILDVLLQHPNGLFLSDLLHESGVSRSPVDTLIKKKVLSLEKKELDRSIVWEQEYFIGKNKLLNDEQQIALNRVKESLNKSHFSTHLLFGVTGSGKTEVYLQAIEHTLKLDKNVIFLIPEIILTSQTIERLKSRFKEKIALLHHRLSHGERFDTWKNILSGKSPIIVGARSALFSPVPKLGLIIVDEEHESCYKQSDDAPCYHARDLAIVRGKICNATVILGSATPSFESYTNALQGKYILSTLTSRPNNFSLPQVHIVDMKPEYEKNKGFTLFSDKLLKEMKQRLVLGEQTLLLLNRRGYHSSQICLSCSHIIKCPHCEMNLTFHLGENILACHLCDYREKPSKCCPSCGKDGQMKFKGAGTELVERSIHAIFPEARVIRMDADTTRKKGSHEELCKKFKSGKADILIGTQMIAKGLHFPLVTLVGVLNADISLQIPDFRSTEQVFQLLTQVAGRSGRGDLKGEVIVQTLIPDHSVLKYAQNQDFESFYNEEKEIRKLFCYPPYVHLMKCTFTGENLEKTLQKAKDTRTFLSRQLPETVELLPLTPCGHAKVQDKYRFQFLLKTTKVVYLLDKYELIKKDCEKQKIKFQVDVDPLSTFF
ncbi:MAG: primosomal protein N' [Chlamydiae bacterium]|nr:primosomal protein N' [Chlamydiota bacterium]